MIDNAYGYILVAGPINDAEQLIIEYFTGRDYSVNKWKKRIFNPGV